MRRHLLVVRHAKSSWDDTSLVDHDRPLAPRGAKALVRMRDHLDRSGHRPEIVWCSSSRRTVETLDGIRAAIPEHVEVVIAEELYVATAGSLLARLRGIGDEIGCTMIVGHNPAVQDLALELVAGGAADIREQLASKLPTGAIVTLSFDGAWADLREGTAVLDDLCLPRKPRS